MSETAVKIKICSSCGVESRDGALFCYNCGSAVTEVEKTGSEPSTSDVWFRGDIVEKDKENESLEKDSVEYIKPVEEVEKVTEDTTESVEKINESSEKKETAKEDNTSLEAIPAPTKAETSSEKKETSSKVNVKNKTEVKPKSKPKPKTKLRSASSLRKSPKLKGAKRVEVIWEEPSSSPNLMFVLVALFLVLIAGGIFFLAMYLK